MSYAKKGHAYSRAVRTAQKTRPVQMAVWDCVRAWAPPIRDECRTIPFIANLLGFKIHAVRNAVAKLVEAGWLTAAKVGRCLVLNIVKPRFRVLALSAPA